MMKNKKIVCFSALILAAGIMIGSIILKESTQKEIEFMSASWIYNFGDIKEISQASDVIALVKVESVKNVYEQFDLPFTEFQVSVTDPVYNISRNDTFTIVMTGAEKTDKIMEVTDDPLLKPGDELLVFCRKNADGTYLILGGPQGRLVYSDEKFNSLNVVNERVREANPYSNITIENADADKLMDEIKSYVN